MTERVRIEGPLVTLRPLRREELEPVLGSLLPWVTDGARERDVRENLLERILASGTLTERELLLGIEAGGRLVGDVQARPDQGPKGVFELGVTVFEESDRGKGYGTAAISMVTSHAFDVLGAHRVQLTTAVANSPMRAIVERLGFVLEGVLRGFWPAADGPHDYAMYALTRGDYQAATGRGRRGRRRRGGRARRRSGVLGLGSMLLAFALTTGYG
ncbi:MAG: GNAT family N-acetyltransferase [Actinobacteria bacterium]|nr:GNAT family N-acetyltransferase [Actinomycetota bacterium]